MYLGPIDESHAVSVFPRSRARSLGIFAWGLPRLSASAMWRTRIELALIFVIAPLAFALTFGAHPPYPILALVAGASAFMLSMTRSFDWRDLTPVDLWSEWRLLAAAPLTLTVAVALAFVVMDLGAATGRIDIISAAAVAISSELALRVLFFRRYGHVFKTHRWATVVSAACSGLFYLIVFGCAEGFPIGVAVGAAQSAIFLRTGSFAVIAWTQFCAVTAFALIAPALCG